MERNKIYVIGGNHHNTLGVIRSLGHKDVRPFVLLVSEHEDLKNYVLRSKYIADYKCFRDYQGAIDWLIANGEDNRNSVVLCTSDGASSAVDLNYDALVLSYRIPNAKRSGVITHYMNKEIMSDFAQKIGLRVPPTWVHNFSDPLPVGIEYPCIVKPLISIEGTKSDIQVCYTPDELNTYIKDASHCTRVQIQKFIVKDYEYQLIGCSLDGGEMVIIPGVSHVIRPSNCSNTGFLTYRLLDESYPVGLAKTFLKQIGYSGLFSMEFLRDKSGNDYFMEINFRNDGNSICVTASGVNLPYIWYLHNSGQDIAGEPTALQKEVYVMPEFDDFVNVLKRKISLFQWIGDVRRTDCFMEYDKSDTRPFFVGLRRLMVSYFGLALRKLHITK